MTVPDSWEGSTNIDERWTEAGVLGGADSSIGDSNLVGAGSRLKQKKFFPKDDTQILKYALGFR